MIFDSRCDAWPTDTGIFRKGFENGSNLTTLKFKVIKACFKRYIQFLGQILTICKKTVISLTKLINMDALVKFILFYMYCSF